MSKKGPKSHKFEHKNIHVLSGTYWWSLWSIANYYTMKYSTDYYTMSLSTQLTCDLQPGPATQQTAQPRHAGPAPVVPRVRVAPLAVRHRAKVQRAVLQLVPGGGHGETRGETWYRRWFLSSVCLSLFWQFSGLPRISSIARWKESPQKRMD